MGIDIIKLKINCSKIYCYLQNFIWNSIVMRRIENLLKMLFIIMRNHTINQNGFFYNQIILLSTFLPSLPFHLENHQALPASPYLLLPIQLLVER